MSALAIKTPLAPRPGRSSPRLDVLNEVHGALVPFLLPIAMHNIGPAGFAAETSWPFPTGATHLFRFTTDAGIEVTLEAIAKHHRVISGVQAPSYLTGFEFVQDAFGRTAIEIGFLLDAVAGTLRFNEIAC